MNHQTDPEDLAAEVRRELIEGGAVPRDLTPLPGQARRVEEHLTRIVSNAPMGPVGPPSRGTNVRSKRWMRTFVLLGTVAAVALVLVIVRPLSPDPHAVAATPPLLKFPNAADGTLPSGTQPAGAELQALAIEAERQPEPANKPVQRVVINAWFASTEQAADGTTKSPLSSVERRSDFAPDGTQHVVERRGPALDQDGRVKISVGEPHSSTITDESFENNDPGPSYVDRLSTDPDDLRRQLESNQDPDVCPAMRASCLTTDIVALFHTYVVPPKLTAALWRMLAAESGISYLGVVHDRLNRPADAFVVMGEDGTTRKLFFLDPDTGAYLGDEEVLIKRSQAFDFDPGSYLLQRNSRLAPGRLARPFVCSRSTWR